MARRRLPGSDRHLAVLVAATTFMELLDTTILSPAAPAMATTFSVAVPDVAVAISAYLVTVAVLTPVSGWVADRVGTRTTITAAITLFTAASALCAVAPSFPLLVGARILQGAGGALMVPVGKLVVLRRTPKSDLVATIAVLTWPALLAPVVAPFLGGVLTTYLSWHWIFLINLPLGVTAATAALVIVPQQRAAVRRRLDTVGFLLTAGALAGLVVLSVLGDLHLGAPTAVATGILVAALSAAAVRHLLITDDPLLDLRVLRIPTYRLGQRSGGLYRAGVYGLPFVLPLMLQLALGWSAVAAGAAVMAVFVGNLAIKPATTWILRRWSFRRVLTSASLVVAITLAACTLITPATPAWLLVADLLVSGAARSVGFTAYITLSMADVPPGQLVHASTLNETVQQIAGGLGVALGALAVAAGVRWSAVGSLLPYRVALIVLAVLVVATLPEVSRLNADAGARLHAPEPDAA